MVLSVWWWFGLTVATTGWEVVLESEGREVVERLGFKSLVRRSESRCEGDVITAATSGAGWECCC